MKRIKFLFLFILLGSLELNAQQYPSWFWNQGGVNCGPTIVGYSEKAFSGDSTAVKNAYKDAVKKFLDYNCLSISGNEKFWNTGSGTLWAGTDIKKQYDTLNFDEKSLNLTAVDTFRSEKFTAVLFARSEASLEANLKTLIACQKEVPSWVEKTPSGSDCIYSVGVSEKYYYEISSWQKSEENALLQIAKQMHLVISSLQKADQNLEEIQKVSFDSKISGFQIISRWKDTSKHLYYTLGKLQKASK